MRSSTWIFTASSGSPRRGKSRASTPTDKARARALCPGAKPPSSCLGRSRGALVSRAARLTGPKRHPEEPGLNQDPPGQGAECGKGEREGSCEAARSPLGGKLHQRDVDAAVASRVVRGVSSIAEANANSKGILNSSQSDCLIPFRRFLQNANIMPESKSPPIAPGRKSDMLSQAQCLLGFAEKSPLVSTCPNGPRVEVAASRLSCRPIKL
jgi:hypothetical protein